MSGFGPHEPADGDPFGAPEAAGGEAFGPAEDVDDAEPFGFEPAARDGRSVALRVQGGQLQWRYTSPPGQPWTDIYDLSSIEGTNGREVELGMNGRVLRWRYTTPANQAWIDLLEIADGTDGTDGRDPELRVDGTNLQWRYAGIGSWITLIDLSTLAGGGDSGGGVEQASFFVHVDDLLAATDPLPTYSHDDTATPTAVPLMYLPDGTQVIVRSLATANNDADQIGRWVRDGAGWTRQPVQPAPGTPVFLLLGGPVGPGWFARSPFVGASAPYDPTDVRLDREQLWIARQDVRLPVATDGSSTSFGKLQIVNPADESQGLTMAEVFVAGVDIPGLGPLVAGGVQMGEWDPFAGGLSGSQGVLAYVMVGLDRFFQPIYRIKAMRYGPSQSVFDTVPMPIQAGDPVYPMDLVTKQWFEANVSPGGGALPEHLNASTFLPSGTPWSKWLRVCATTVEDEDGEVVSRTPRQLRAPDDGPYVGAGMETRARFMVLHSNRGNFLEWLTKYRATPEEWDIATGGERNYGDQDGFETAAYRNNEGRYGEFKESCWNEDPFPVDAGEHDASRVYTNREWTPGGASVTRWDRDWWFREGEPVEVMHLTWFDVDGDHREQILARWEHPGFDFTSPRDGTNWRVILQRDAPGPGSLAHQPLTDWLVGTNDGDLLIDYVRQWDEPVEGGTLRLSLLAEDATEDGVDVTSSEVPGLVWTNQNAAVIDLRLEVLTAPAEDPDPGDGGGLERLLPTLMGESLVLRPAEGDALANGWTHECDISGEHVVYEFIVTEGMVPPDEPMVVVVHCPEPPEGKYLDFNVNIFNASTSIGLSIGALPDGNAAGGTQAGQRGLYNFIYEHGKQPVVARVMLAG